jgi:hypothetical protein
MKARNFNFIYFFLLIVIIFGFNTANGTKIDVYLTKSLPDTLVDFDTLKFVKEVDSLNLFTTNRENFKYSIYYAEIGEGHWSVEFFFDSLFNFISSYVNDVHGGADFIEYSVFRNKRMCYLIDSVDDGDVCWKRFVAALNDFKGIEENISYTYENDKIKSKEIKYSLLTKLDFDKREREVLDDLNRYIMQIKRHIKDFNYADNSETKYKNKYIYSDTYALTPYENNITNVEVDSALFVNFIKKDFNY